MENKKWLKRKYPESFDELNEFLNDSKLNGLKKYKYLIGRLVEDIKTPCGESYKIGKLVMFKRSNPVNDYNYPDIHAVIKCNSDSVTKSGYHSLTIHEHHIEEIKF